MMGQNHAQPVAARTLMCTSSPRPGTTPWTLTASDPKSTVVTSSGKTGSNN